MPSKGLLSFHQLKLIGSQLQAERTVNQLHITIAVTGWLNDKIPGYYKDR